MPPSGISRHGVTFLFASGFATSRAVSIKKLRNRAECSIFQSNDSVGKRAFASSTGRT